ncbi:MAG: bifunctional metallophosphatase/5'-nucleotidase, partial [Eubacteriales bacterium]|nr:bifunctional metallophosphatase/5'-nucleotidase [Eubacteriales bacterium]
MRKTLSVLLTLLLIFSALFPALAEEPQLSDDVVILFTNDTHSYIDGPLSFDIVGGLKNELQKQYKYVLLVDAGDAVQGTAYGGMDNGYNIISLMNAAGYDLAAPGNHETDYTMVGFMNILSWAQFPYISCNF